MPRKHITDVEKGIAIGMHEMGSSLNSIAKRLRRDKKTIRELLRKYNTTQDVSRRPGSGRPRKTSERDDRRIARETKRDRFITLENIGSNLQLNVSVWTISRRLHEAGFHSYWAVKKPYISETNQRKRRIWCREHINWTVEQWNRVLWSDESPFVLRYNGRKRVWRMHNERYATECMQGTVKHDKKINVWGCFADSGVGHLFRIHGILNQQKYRQLLIHHMRPSVRTLFNGNNCIFQQDNDPKHTARTVKAYLSRCPFQIMEWPSQSPDLNPIENLWSQLDRELSDRNPQSKHELFEVLQQGWSALSPQYLHSLVQSMPDRCRAVLKSGGKPTKY